MKHCLQEAALNTAPFGGNPSPHSPAERMCARGWQPEGAETARRPPRAAEGRCTAEGRCVAASIPPEPPICTPN